MAALEFIVAAGEENLEDRLALMPERIETATMERDLSVRMLRHLATSVNHQQYFDMDILTMRVEPPT